MAQQFYTIDLQDTVFPMLSEQQTRTIIGSTAGESPAKGDKPYVAYCHNVMPSQYGFDSISFNTAIPAAESLPDGLEFSDVRVAYGDEQSRVYLAWDTEGNVYSTADVFTAWIPLPATVPATGGASFDPESVTIGTVNGISYIFYAGIGAFNYDESAAVLVAVTLTGLSIPDTLGVVGSSGYLIAYTNLAVAWSSTIDPTDFIPSTVTGSGGGNVAGTQGAILFILANSLGFLAYTSANTIAGTYTGNTQFPFKFRQVDDSNGGINLDLVAYENTAQAQFIFSKGGLQTITSTRATNILPEVTDFLAGRVFEDYNETTKQYEVTNLPITETMIKKIKLVASRYLVISYGTTSFTHALVFDIALQKLGKLRIDHVDVFEYIGQQTEISKDSIAFVLSTGEVQVVDFSASGDSPGVLILGKLQFVRTRLINLLEVQVENVNTSSTLSVSSQASLDGKNFTSVDGGLISSATNIRKYAFRSTAKNHSIVFIGKFNIVTALVTFTTDGRR